MVRYVSPSELQRLMRDAARRQQDAVNAYNRKVDQHNRNVVRQRQEAIRSIEQFNRAADSHNRGVQRKQQAAIDDLNRAIRAHNANVRANENRQRVAFSRIPMQIVQVRFPALTQSTVTLNESYARLAAHVGTETSDGNDELVFEFPSSENANSLEVMAALADRPTDLSPNPDQIRHSLIEAELRGVSNDLDSRWKGAVFALDPRNPDAARHFCTSAREIFTTILDSCAPDTEVLRQFPRCAITPNGTPTRREKIRYLLHRRSISSPELGGFIEDDISNVLELFPIFNGATHGEAGRYELGRLAAIKKRVEGGILFLTKLV